MMKLLLFATLLHFLATSAKVTLEIDNSDFPFQTRMVVHVEDPNKELEGKGIGAALIDETVPWFHGIVEAAEGGSIVFDTANRSYVPPSPPSGKHKYTVVVYKDKAAPPKKMQGFETSSLGDKHRNFNEEGVKGLRDAMSEANLENDVIGEVSVDVTHEDVSNKQ